MKAAIPKKELFAVIAAIMLFIASCGERSEGPATGPSYTYDEWPYSVPARIYDNDNPELFIMTLGKVETPLADGVFDPVADRVTLSDGTSVENYYREKLGIKHYSVIDKSIFPLPPSGMCTWYYYYQDINEEETRLNADWIASNLADYGATYVQIDDGWQKEREGGRHGSRDWTGVDTAFSSGMESLADYIKSKGLVPGIWIAPHGQSNDSVVMANPGVFLFKPDSTTASNTWEGNWLIDPTSEAAHKYLGDLFREMAGWGYEYFKIDGQPIVVNEYESKQEFMQQPGEDNELLYRKTLNTIREAIGDESYLLGCWGTPVEGIGIMNGSRTGGDVVLGWSGFDVALMPTMRYYFLHNIAWYTDPDVMLLRQPLTFSQAEVWATLQGLTGQALMSSDRLMDLSDDRVKLMKRVYPAVDIRPLDLFPSNSRKTIWDLKINHLGRDYDVVGLFNFGESEISQVHLDFDDLGLTEDVPYHVFDFWNNEYLGAWERGIALEVAPTSCRVITIMPDNGKLRLVSTSRHITQGWVDLEELEIEENSLSGESNVIGGDPYQLHIAFPRGKFYNIKSIRVNGGGKAVTAITNHQTWATATITPSRTGEIEWEVVLEPTEYNYKYITRDPGRVSAEPIGLDGVRLSWRAQYYLNAGYQVYLDDELVAYSPATYIELKGLDPNRDYRVEVKTVWSDGDVSEKPANNRDEPFILNIGKLTGKSYDLTLLSTGAGDRRIFGAPEVNGVTYEKYLAAYGSSSSDFRLHGLYDRLEVMAGISDFTFDEVEGGITFVVKGDGEVLYRSKLTKKGDRVFNISVNIDGVDSLTLETEYSGEGGRRRAPVAVWINPVVSRR